PGEVVRVSEEGTVVAVDLATGAERELAALGIRNTGLTLSPDGRFATADVPGGKSLVDTASWKELRRFDARAYLTWIRTRDRMFLGVRSNWLASSEPARLLDPATLREVVLGSRDLYCFGAEGIAPLPDGRFAVILSGARIVLLDAEGRWIRRLFPADE